MPPSCPLGRQLRGRGGARRGSCTPGPTSWPGNTSDPQAPGGRREAGSLCLGPRSPWVGSDVGGETVSGLRVRSGSRWRLHFRV